MKNNDFNLIVLHHKEVFETREQALTYLEDYYKPNSLEGEPVIVKYGETRNPNVILAFGTSDAAPAGSYYSIDMGKAEEQIDELIESISDDNDELENVSEILEGVVNATGLTLDENKIQDKISYDPDTRDDVIGNAETIAEAIDLLSKYTQRELAQNEMSVEDTKSVELDYSEGQNGGMTLKANVKISNDGDSDDLNFNNNLIGIKSDGLYSAANLEYDDARHQLIFTTSGYKNGRFQDDAIVQRVDLGEHTKLIASNDGKTVKLTIVDNNDYTTTLSADLQIADRENNILKTSDGKVYVDGTAMNIKYGESTVAATLTAHKNRLTALETNVENAAKSAHIEGGQTDTLETAISQLSDGGAKVTGNVRLGSANSIVVRNGGLEANITVDVDTATNKLIVTIGNDRIEKILPGIELFESAEYDDANEALIIKFRTGNVLEIPIAGLIHTWDTQNSANSPIVLTKTTVTSGTDTLSGNIKLRSTDNLIGIENGNLYVSEQAINNKVATETSRATAAETELRTSIQTLTSNTETQFSGISNSISEIRATANHADEIATEAKEGVTTLNTTVGGISTNLSALETTVDGLTQTVEEIPTLRSGLANEITTRTNKDTELDSKITTLTQNLSNETNRAQTAEETLNARIEHDIEDVNETIANEIQRANEAEEALSSSVEELSERIGSGSEQTLADAKAYTDTKVLAEENARKAKDIEIETAITTAVRDASDDATQKATDALTDAKAYTDTKVLAEEQRATAAEQANADAIDALTTEVGNKVETVEIVKNSQSDLQYTLKVDGQDAGEINIPKDQFLRSASYDSGNKQLIFVFETSEGVVTTNVDVNDLVDTYNAGNGLELSNNVFSLKINQDSENYLTLTSEGITLLGIDAKFAETATNANAYADTKVLAEEQRATAAEQANADAIDAEITRATAAEQTNADAIAVINGNEATEGSVKNAIKVAKDYTDEKVATKANASDVYTKTEIDNKGYLTQHQDISNLATKASVENVTTTANNNADAISALTTEVDNIKFNVDETDTVRTTMAQTANGKVLSSDVKLKTISGVENTNIIKSDANGIYATVSLSYNKAENKLTFNDGNGDKEFELNNFGILQDAFYDSENESIVLIVKKDDETTERITIPVSGLVNTWNVDNGENNPIVLQKTSGDEGDILTANISILNNANNLLVNDNGSLFVDSDSNQHVALWGSDVISVQGAINLLKERTDDIEEMKQNIEDLEEDNENIKIALASYQTDLDTQKDRIDRNEDDIDDLKDRMHDLELQMQSLTTQVSDMGDRVDGAAQDASDALTIINNLIQKIGDIDSSDKTIIERLNRIEYVLEQLIDFGEYDIEL